MSDIKTKKEALAAINKTKPKAKPTQPDPAQEQPQEPVSATLQDFHLPELTHEFDAQTPTKTRRRLPIQIGVIGGSIFLILAVVQAVTSGNSDSPKPAVATRPQPTIGMPEDDKDAIIKSQAVQISELKQKYETGNVTDAPGQNKLTAVPQKPIVVPKTTPAQPNRRPPSAVHRVSRPIQVRRSVPPSRPRIVYRNRPAPKPAVAARPPAPRPQPVAQAPKPAANFSLAQQSAFTPKPVQPARPVTPKPIRSIKVSTSHPVRKPITTKPVAKAPPPQGILVASLTGDLLEDNQVSDVPTVLYPASSSPLGKGLISPGTTAKAKLDNPITWIPQNSDAIIGQRYLLTLSEDLGAMAKKGSKVIAEVTSAEGDFLSMQVVEVNQQPIEHVNLTDESPDGRKTPVAVVQYKQSPYLQAKLKGQGEGFGNKLLRVGLNVGIDQLRSSSVGDRASSLVSSFAPNRSSRSRNGLYHFDKEVEIYFVEGV
ncbi:hypothetical protein [Acaryochloris sp. CCMEE 5410]|uniref:hypothetical protein n=1 Tax=Acaryochloris sp. CCMEE 5410 TaxID=310037 RepID=UPI00024844CC|nr:hypothetical protein [Acaryochloris sp. CCMEE 5410]KAI9129752.1 hypothetical protein ON05_031930 [Acaryochloris sp. CCMEE 5410]